MSAIRTAAEAVPHRERDDFLRLVAAGLAALAPDAIGVGTVNHVVRDVLVDPRFRADYAVGPSERQLNRRSG
jgi:hypothetical protein